MSCTLSERSSAKRRPVEKNVCKIARSRFPSRVSAAGASSKRSNSSRNSTFTFRCSSLKRVTLSGGYTFSSSSLSKYRKNARKTVKWWFLLRMPNSRPSLVR